MARQGSGRVEMGFLYYSGSEIVSWGATLKSYQGEERHTGKTNIIRGQNLRTIIPEGTCLILFTIKSKRNKNLTGR